MARIYDKSNGRVQEMFAHALKLDGEHWAKNGEKVLETLDLWLKEVKKHRGAEGPFEEWMYNNFTPHTDQLKFKLGFQQWGDNYEVILEKWGTEGLNLGFVVYFKGDNTRWWDRGEFVMNGGVVFNEDTKRWGVHT